MAPVHVTAMPVTILVLPPGSLHRARGRESACIVSVRNAEEDVPGCAAVGAVIGDAVAVIVVAWAVALSKKPLSVSIMRWRMAMGAWLVRETVAWLPCCMRAMAGTDMSFEGVAMSHEEG